MFLHNLYGRGKHHSAAKKSQRSGKSKNSTLLSVACNLQLIYGVYLRELGREMHREESPDQSIPIRTLLSGESVTYSRVSGGLVPTVVRQEESSRRSGWVVKPINSTDQMSSCSSNARHSVWVQIFNQLIEILVCRLVHGSSCEATKWVIEWVGVRWSKW